MKKQPICAVPEGETPVTWDTLWRIFWLLVFIVAGVYALFCVLAWNFNQPEFAGGRRYECDHEWYRANGAPVTLNCYSEDGTGWAVNRMDSKTGRIIASTTPL